MRMEHRHPSKPGAKRSSFNFISKRHPACRTYGLVRAVVPRRELLETQRRAEMPPYLQPPDTQASADPNLVTLALLVGSMAAVKTQLKGIVWDF